MDLVEDRFGLRSPTASTGAACLSPDDTRSYFGVTNLSDIISSELAKQQELCNIAANANIDGNNRPKGQSSLCSHAPAPAAAATPPNPTPSPAAPLPPSLLAPAHRLLLVRWMCEVAGALGLQRGTLGLGVGLLDRWAAAGAAKVAPPESLLQLAAMACMSIAIKHEEVCQPRPSQWLALAADGRGQPLYTACDLQRMEWAVLCAVGWRLHVPTPFTFMHHFLACLPPARPAAAAAATPQRLSPQQAPRQANSYRARRVHDAAIAPRAAASTPAAIEIETRGPVGSRRRRRSSCSSASSAHGCCAAAAAAAAAMYEQAEYDGEEQGGAAASEACACGASPAPAQPSAADNAEGWLPVVGTALRLLERSLQHAPLQRYPPSTLALAALAVAEAEAAGGTSGGAVTDDVYGSRRSPAVAAVCAAAGVAAERLAPGLAGCCEEMGERCCGGCAPGERA